MKLNHFSLSEFDSPDLPNSGEQMNKDFLEKLDKLRGMCGFPFIVTSGYRTPDHNKRVGGAPRSYHVKGRAADIHVKHGWQVFMIVSFASRCGLHGIGISFPKHGNGFVHVDDRDIEKATMWRY